VSQSLPLPARELGGRRLKLLPLKAVACHVRPQSANVAAIRRRHPAEIHSEVFSEALDVSDAQAVHQFVEGVVAKFAARISV